MPDSEDIPYDVPEADAVDQQRLADPTPDDEDAPQDQGQSVPLESNAADWHEQQLTVNLDPEPEE